MHCCYGNHILETHWYGSLFAFADEMLRLGARPAGSLMGSKVVERIGKEGKERGERGDGEEREEDKRKEEGGEKGSKNQTASQGTPSPADLARQRRTCPVELSEGKRPELEPSCVMPVCAEAPAHLLAFTPSLSRRVHGAHPGMPGCSLAAEQPARDLEPEEPNLEPLTSPCPAAQAQGFPREADGSGP